MPGRGQIKRRTSGNGVGMHGGILVFGVKASGKPTPQRNKVGGWNYDQKNGQVKIIKKGNNNDQVTR